MENNSYAFVMSGSRDENLRDYLINRRKYVPDAVAAALSELQQRGAAIAKEELEAAQQYIREKRAEIAKKEKELAVQEAKEVVPATDMVQDIPVYYSKGAIYLFSVLFSTFFGAILLAINFYKEGKRSAIFPVLGFSILYMGIIAVAVSYFTASIFIVLIFNLIGAYVLDRFFWNKYIGRDTQYQHRPVWLPLIIFIVIAVGVSLLIYATYGSALI